MEKIAYCIFMNDGLMAVVLDDQEKATKKLDSLKNHYYTENRWNFNNDYLKYETICYWHIHDCTYE